MKNKVGVMQGRLLPKYLGRYQAHPLGSWEQEFEIAKKVGLDNIEFILDYNDADKNPLLKVGGVDEILSVSNKTGVVIKTICADYFMEAPLYSVDNSVAEKSLKVLIELLEASSEIGVTDIVIPCVDQSTLGGIEAEERFVSQIQKVIPNIEKKNINLSLETDLAPQPFVNLLNKINSNRITVNYDTGNSAALGYDPIEELNAYGDRITDIHIKDRVLGGGPVTLGEGNTDFVSFFNKLKEFNYLGPFIMQAYRDEEGVEIFKKQLSWIMPYIENLHQ